MKSKDKLLQFVRLGVGVMGTGERGLNTGASRWGGVHTKEVERRLGQGKTLWLRQRDKGSASGLYIACRRSDLATV